MAHVEPGWGWATEGRPERWIRDAAVPKLSVIPIEAATRTKGDPRQRDPKPNGVKGGRGRFGREEEEAGAARRHACDAQEERVVPDHGGSNGFEARALLRLIEAAIADGPL